MHFEITASQQAVRKPLTTAQRNSSLFSEAPRIGAQTLRRGQVLKFDVDQMKQHEVMLKRLFDAGAIEIVEVDGDERHDLRKEMSKRVEMKGEKKTEKKEPEAPPPSAPKPPPVIEFPATPPPEPMKNEAFPTPEELVAAVSKENKETEVQIEKALTPVDEVSSTSASVHAEVSKGKKGRK